MSAMTPEMQSAYKYQANSTLNDVPAILDYSNTQEDFYTKRCFKHHSWRVCIISYMPHSIVMNIASSSILCVI